MNEEDEFYTVFAAGSIATSLLILAAICCLRCQARRQYQHNQEIVEGNETDDIPPMYEEHQDHRLVDPATVPVFTSTNSVITLNDDESLITRNPPEYQDSNDPNITAGIISTEGVENRGDYEELIPIPDNQGSSRDSSTEGGDRRGIDPENPSSRNVGSSEAERVPPGVNSQNTTSHL